MRERRIASERSVEPKDREARWREWMVAAQGGDSQAYENLLLDLLPHLRSFLRSRLRSDALVEDVAQNVLLSIHRARHTYRPERPFGPWWRAIARNAAIDAVRSHGRRSAREIPLPEGFEAAAPEEAREAGERGLSSALEQALARLPPGQREAVELLHVKGYSVRDAAARAGISPGALKVRAHRGARALRKRLRGESA